MHRPPANYFDADLLGSASSRPSTGPTPTAARAVVLCSEGRHFCAGLDFGAADRPGARGPRHPLRHGDAPGRRPAADGGRRAGFGRRRRTRPRPGRRLPGGGDRQPVRRQLRPARIPPGLRHLVDPARGRRPAGGPRAAHHRATRRRSPRRWPSACATGSTTTPGPGAHALAGRSPRSAPLAVRSIRRTLRADLVARFGAMVDHERAEQLRLDGARPTSARGSPRRWPAASPSSAASSRPRPCRGLRSAVPGPGTARRGWRPTARTPGRPSGYSGMVDEQGHRAGGERRRPRPG